MEASPASSTPTSGLTIRTRRRPESCAKISLKIVVWGRGCAPSKRGIAPLPHEIHCLCGADGRAGCPLAQLEHAVADVAVLGQMGGSNGFTAGGNHLVERAAFGELRVEFPAEFTRPAGACVKAMDDGCIDVFHGGSWGRAKTDSPGLWAETKYSAGTDSSTVGRRLCTTRDGTCTSPNPKLPKTWRFLRCRAATWA